MTLSELINRYYDQLNANDIYICQYISTHKQECANLTIDQLASRCNVSRTTILRFAKKLSLKGYSDLKVYLRLENEKSVLDQKDFLEEACDMYHHAIEDFKERNCTELCRMIYEAKRVIVYGTGYMQSSVAADMKRKFLNVGKLFLQLEGASETQRILKLLEPGDLFFIISLSGENAVGIEFAKQLKLSGIPVISLTKLKENTLSRLSSASIYVGTSVVQTRTYGTFETAMLFYMMTEILLLKYAIFKKNVEQE